MSTETTDQHPHQATPTGKPRARAIGLNYRGTPGPHNATTNTYAVGIAHAGIIAWLNQSPRAH